MASYLHKHVKNKASQRQRVAGTVKNEAGGYAYPVDNWKRLERFLILGSEGGTYYATEQGLTKQNMKSVNNCIVDDGVKVVEIVKEISDQGRAPKNNQALLVLAMCASAKDIKTRQAAFDALPDVARIGTHLFDFVAYMKSFRGWGRAARRAVADWYLQKDVDRLAYQICKYPNRNDWSNRDLLRLAHPVDTDDSYEADERNAVFDWVAHENIGEATPDLIKAFEKAKEVDVSEIPDLIREHNLTREMIPLKHLRDKKVWLALAEKMPINALIRNLGRLSALGVIKDIEDSVVSKLTNPELLKKARVHPITALTALHQYSQGHGLRGSLTWNVSRKIKQALDDAFYLSFPNHKGSGKRILLGIDVSASMDGGNISGTHLTPRDAACAMALITMATEDHYEVVCFSDGGSNSFARLEGYRRSGLCAAPFSENDRLERVIKSTRALPFCGTDCSLPIMYASETGKEFDGFIIYTDSETWAGSIHPSEALKAYREQMGIMSKLVVVGMTANRFSIADPNDAGMLDVVGFDTATPQLISDFVKE